jgi:hypothetical protein
LLLPQSRGERSRLPSSFVFINNSTIALCTPDIPDCNINHGLSLTIRSRLHLETALTSNYASAIGSLFERDNHTARQEYKISAHWTELTVPAARLCSTQTCSESSRLVRNSSTKSTRATKTPSCRLLLKQGREGTPLPAAIKSQASGLYYTHERNQISRGLARHFGSSPAQRSSGLHYGILGTTSYGI